MKEGIGMESKNKENKNALNEIKLTGNTYTTKEMANALGMTGKQLRRILRSMDKYNDGIYTRYSWTKQDYDRIVAGIKKMLDGKKAKDATQE